jgi:hypothetical protein
VVANPDDGVLQNATEIGLLEELLLRVPNECPMRGHRPVFCQPTMATQKWCLVAITAGNLPHLRWLATSTRGVELGAVVEGEQEVDEYIFLGLEFVHMSYILDRH